MRLNLFVSAALGLVLAASATAGEFGNQCTTGLSGEQQIKTDCSVRSEYRGKTYCFSSEESKSMFLMHPDETIAKAKAFYSKQTDGERVKISQEEAIRTIKSGSCDLSNKDAGYLDFKGMDLSHCKMTNTSFFGANLIGANLSGADMQRSYLNLARLENANLSKANLTDATIFQAIFSKTNFSGANLTNARVIGTLGDVDMSGALVKKGRFGLDIGNQPMGQMKFDSVGGKFANTDFEGADLNIASFSFGDLKGANLRNANLHRADLSQADLSGADLTDANLAEADVDGAVFKDAKGLQSIKGLNSVKGKCRDCEGIASR